jgi:5-methyltetrahydropteroyltriglutamate--homocysteine methyltransferase
MKIETSVAGVLPRPQELISKTRLFDRGKITEQELETEFKEHTKTIINDQLSVSLSQINGGMLKRQDLLRPFSSNLVGCEVGPMVRWFNNNTFYKTPIVNNKIEWEISVTLEEIYLDLLPKADWKAVLPAPYTLATLSHDNYYKSELLLMFDFADVINLEAKFLEKCGFKHIQFSDPALVYDTTKPKNLACASKALEIATNGLKSKTTLQTYFGDGTPVLKEAEIWDVNNIGIDLYETDLKSMKIDHDKGLVLGIIDARNSVIEDVKSLTSIVKKIQTKNNPKEISLSTNCDMDFLTYDKAIGKMDVLTQVSAKLGEE